MDLLFRVASVFGNWEQKSICQNVFGKSLCRLPFCEQGYIHPPGWALPETICITCQLFLSLTLSPITLQEGVERGWKLPYTLTHTHMYAQPRGRWGGQEGISSAMQTAIVLVKKWPGSKPILPLEGLLQQQCNLQPGFFSLTLPLPLCFLPSRADQLENPSSR